MYVGKKIKQLRVSLDYNQSEMAAKLGVSQSYYSSVEAGKKPATKKMFNTLKVLFNVDMYFFIGGDFSKNRGVSSDENRNHLEISTYYKRISEKFYIEKDEKWNALHESVIQKLNKLNDYYQNIISVKELLVTQVKIAIKNKEVDKSYVAFEIDMIYNYCGCMGVDAGIKANNSTLEELLIFNDELFDVLQLLEVRFFELFHLLYRGLTYSKLPKNLPSEID